MPKVEQVKQEEQAIERIPPRVAVVFGSQSDWPAMTPAIDLLRTYNEFPVIRVLSAHRALIQTLQFAQRAEARGIKVIIAGAGGAAALPGIIAAATHLPVIGVPIPTPHLGGQDSLLSMVQMPAGVPVGVMAIGSAGPVNAVLFALEILALHDEELKKKLLENRASLKSQSEAVEI